VSPPRRAVAERLAREAAAGAPRSAPPDGRARAAWWALGDPQAPLSTVFAVLELHGLLADDGRLVPEVGLVSIGDHFDHGPAESVQQAAADGLAFLAWLALHPADQVTILAGNHDLARVGELVAFDDARFAEARAEARLAYRDGAADAALEQAWLARFPELPSAEVAARDFSAFARAQTHWVEALLRVGRLRLAAARGRVLLTHAGVTVDDLALAADTATTAWSAVGAAAALNAALARALGVWAPATPLELPGLHTPGSAARGEGGGILFHRAAAKGPQAAFAGPLRRRFDPRRLPAGMTQVIGHVRDKKSRELLAPWVEGPPAGDGPPRHLVTDGEQVRYRTGLPERLAVEAPEALLIFIDGGLGSAAPERYQLLPLPAG
jgi:hypothetical protein